MNRITNTYSVPLHSKAHCACCKMTMLWGYQLVDTGEVIDTHCKHALDKIESAMNQRSRDSITDVKAHELGISKHQVEFFDVKYVELKTIRHELTKEEREAADNQAMQDELDLFG